MPNDRAPTQPAQLNHRDAALQHLHDITDERVNIRAAQVPAIVAAVHAQLAQVDALDRLTAAIQAAEFPTLEISKARSGFGWNIKAKR